jgi:cysteinyl-tRNA synthetase
MALDLVGTHFGRDVLDIHAGGVDLIFPHHEDEIAQSCAHTGRPEFARFWLHGEFLTMAGTKMSKRFGNILTARDLKEEGKDAGAVRLLVFNTHYRQKLDWSDDALAAAESGSRRLGEFRDRLVAATPAGEDAEWTALAERSWGRFAGALDDDLNAPQALAAMFDFAREGNALLDAGRRPSAAARQVWERMDDVLAVTPSPGLSVRLDAPRDLAPEGGSERQAEGRLTEEPPAEPRGQIAWATAWARVRREAKAGRDYAEADRIRELLRRHGWEIRDSRDGTVEVKRIGGA